MSKKNHEQDLAEKASESKAKRNRRVYIFGRLENEIMEPVINRLLKLNERDPQKPIDLYINSAGGNGYNADAIIAVIHSLSCPVNTICLGHALSGACEILASGTGSRSAYEFSTLMFHQTLWEADGDITNLEIQAAQGQRFREAQIELLHRCTGQEKARIRKDIERDFYLSAFEALEYGIIDNVISHKSTNHKVAPKAYDTVLEEDLGEASSKVAAALAVRRSGGSAPDSAPSKLAKRGEKK